MRSGFALSFSSALLVFATGVSAQTLIYDNGSIVTHPGGGVAGIDASALDNTATFHTPHNVYGFGAQWAAGAGNSVADDFTVCGTWSVSHIEVPAYQTLAAPPTITGLYAQIWDHDPSVAGNPPIWGNLTTNLVTSSPTGTHIANRTLIGNFATDAQRQVAAIRVAVTGLTLNPGVYWIEYQLTGVTTSGPWVPPVTENEINDTGNAKQRQGALWVVLNNAIAPATAGVAIPFRMYGSSTGTQASVTAYGAGKAGTNGVGAWDLGPAPIRRPIPGRDFVLKLINGFAGSAPTVLIGSPLVAGFPFPPVGTAYVLPIFATISMPAFNATFVSTLRLPIPHGNNLCGAQLGLQGLWADPGAAGFPVAHSDGMLMTIGH